MGGGKPARFLSKFELFVWRFKMNTKLFFKYDIKYFFINCLFKLYSMYLECRICERVTDHKLDESQSRTYHFTGAGVDCGVFYICPGCQTGVSGTNLTSNIAPGNFQSSFEKSPFSR